MAVPVCQVVFYRQLGKALKRHASCCPVSSLPTLTQSSSTSELIADVVLQVCRNQACYPKLAACAYILCS